MVTGATGDVSASQRSSSASGFLATGYEPLERWMDERFKVRYENMPLAKVFEQQPIADIRYQMESLPQNATVFHLVSSSISRREILKEISDFFGLDMFVEMVAGQPSHVLVRGRGVGQPSSATDVGNTLSTGPGAPAPLPSDSFPSVPLPPEPIYVTPEPVVTGQLP